MVKAAEAPRVGGALATFTTHHVAGGSAAFFVEVQHCYASAGGSTIATAGR